MSSQVLKTAAIQMENQFAFSLCSYNGNTNAFTQIAAPQGEPQKLGSLKLFVYWNVSIG